MAYAYAYEKLIADKKLNQKDLPEEVQIAISEIAKTEKGMSLIKNKKEKKGEAFKVSDSVAKKIKAMDTFAVRGILDHLSGEDVKAPVPEITADVIIDQVIDDNKTKPVDTPQGAEPKDKAPAPSPEPEPAPEDKEAKDIELELHEMHKSKIETLSLSDIKSKAPNCYKVIFDAYEAESANGIETTRYSLLETEKEVFKLTKK